MSSMSIDSPFGKISIFEENGFVVKIGFFSEACAAENSDSPTLKAAAAQLEEYFSGGRKDFSVPLNPQGTDFQKKVWRAAEKIKFGQTASYKRIAELVGKPNAARAVGGALGRNPVPILIPCHRIVGANGRLTGFALGLDCKKKLLEIEKL